MDFQLTSLHLHFALANIYILKAKLLLYFYDDKRNAYRLEILIWCNEDWDMFLYVKEGIVFSYWQFF